MANRNQKMEENDLSIHRYLNDELLSKIISCIKNRCKKFEESDAQEREEFNFSKDIYDKIFKGRKAHTLTSGLNADLYNEKDNLKEFQLILTENGNFYQPELINDEVIIHIYYKSSMDSNLIKKRAKENKTFFCIQFIIDKKNKLRTIDAIRIHKDGTKGFTENIYSTPKENDNML